MILGDEIGIEEGGRNEAEKVKTYRLVHQHVAQKWPFTPSNSCIISPPLFSYVSCDRQIICVIICVSDAHRDRISSRGPCAITINELWIRNRDVFHRGG